MKSSITMRSVILKLLSTNTFPTQAKIQFCTPTFLELNFCHNNELVTLSIGRQITLRYLDLGFDQWLPVAIVTPQLSLNSGICLGGYWEFDRERTYAIREISDRLASELLAIMG